jgi:hypothetical protein
MLQQGAHDPSDLIQALVQLWLVGKLLPLALRITVSRACAVYEAKYRKDAP